MVTDGGDRNSDRDPSFKLIFDTSDLKALFFFHRFWQFGEIFVEKNREKILVMSQMPDQQHVTTGRFPRLAQPARHPVPPPPLAMGPCLSAQKNRNVAYHSARSMKNAANNPPKDIERNLIQLFEKADKSKFRFDEVISGGSYSCLLYTSPSPRDKRQSRMPSSA